MTVGVSCCCDHCWLVVAAAATVTGVALAILSLLMVAVSWQDRSQLYKQVATGLGCHGTATADTVPCLPSYNTQ